MSGMPTCRSCGAFLQPDWDKCKICGAPAGQGPAAPSTPPNTPAPGAPPPDGKGPSNTSIVTVVIAVVAGLVLVVGAIAVYSAISGDGGGEIATDAGSESTTDTLLPPRPVAQCQESGTAESSVAAYRAEPGVHPMLLYVDVGDGWEQQTSFIPDAFDASDSEGSAELVACVTLAQETLIVSCPGYQTRQGGAELTVEYVDATYDVRVYARQTGEEVAAAQLPVQHSTRACPDELLLTFDNEDEPGLKRLRPGWGDALEPFLLPLGQQ